MLHGPELSHNVIECVLHIFGHISSIPAHIDVGTALVDQLPQVFPVSLQKVLDIDLVGLLPGKGHIKLREGTVLVEAG